MIRSLTLYKNGAVRLLITGEYPERFINFCLNDGIYLWSVKKKNKQLIAWMYLKDFSKIRLIVHKSKVKIKIIGRYGFPFLFKKVQKRKILLGGAVAFFIAIYWLSGYIWFVDVQGLKNISSDDIGIVLKQEGLIIGARRDNIDEKAIEKKIMVNIPNVAWVGIRFIGTKAIIEIVEKVNEFAETRNLGNLVASKDGIITDCIVLSGEKIINVGDKVKEGDVLIKGIAHENEQGKNKNVVQAEGFVKARVCYESYGEAPLKKYLYNRTGKSDFSIKFCINDKNIIVKEADLTNFSAYEIEHIIKNTDGWRNSWFTVELNIDVYRELNVNLMEFTIDEAKNLAIVNALATSKNFISEDAYVISRNETLVESGDSNLIKVKMQVETEEDIGKHIKYNEE